MKEKIRQEMAKPVHSEYPLFFVICVTIGPDPNYIYGKDGDSDRISIQEVQEVMSQCEQFRGKPKVLLVHTVPKCQCK
jgi:hypothetical protein